jgi:hypothetical protein
MAMNSDTPDGLPCHRTERPLTVAPAGDDTVDDLLESLQLIRLTTHAPALRQGGDHAEHSSP